MTRAKKNLKDLVVASYIKPSTAESPYANLRFKFSPKKLQDFIAALSETEKEEYLAFCNSPEGKREQKVLEAQERKAARERALIRKRRIFNERYSKLTLKVDRNPELSARLTEARCLSINEIAEALVVFPELLPDGHKAPTLALARKCLKVLLTDEEKEYLRYVWADTPIPVDVCFSGNQQRPQSAGTHDESNVP